MRLSAVILAAAVAAFMFAGCGGDVRSSSSPYVPPSYTLPSGLVVQDWVIGNGDSPDRGQVVNVQCASSTSDGVFLEDRKYTFVAGVNKILPAWDEGVSGMRVGGQRKLTIPPSRRTRRSSPPWSF
jgi:FKBP-type peptidyl-prolyl cis-trans isomerase